MNNESDNTKRVDAILKDIKISFDMFSTPTIVRLKNNTNCKGHAHDKLINEWNSGDTCCTGAVLET